MASLPTKIDTRDVAVEIDAHAGPVEARRDLLDMGRFAGAVIAGDHDAAVIGEARQDREGGLLVEQVIRIEVRNIAVTLAVGRHFEIAVDAEGLAHGKTFVSGSAMGLSIVSCIHASSSIRPLATAARDRPFATSLNLISCLRNRVRLIRGLRVCPCHFFSAQTRSLESVMRPDDIAQPFLEGPIAAMGVGMEALDQISCRSS